MNTKRALKDACLAALSLLVLSPQATIATTGKPVANPAGTGLWTEANNWTGKAAPTTGCKAIFNINVAANYIIKSAVTADQVVPGDGGPARGDRLETPNCQGCPEPTPL